MSDEQAAVSSRGAQTRVKLRRGAREAFGELGWQATRVEDITKRAGVSHGTFYTYYDNKAAVLADLVEQVQSELLALASAPWKADDVRGALERIIGGFLDRYVEDAVVMRTWLQAARDERDFSALYMEARTLFVRRVVEHVGPVLAASGRRDGPPALTVASSLVAMVEHFAYCWAVLGEEHERADAVEALVSIWGATLNELAGFRVI